FFLLPGTLSWLRPSPVIHAWFYEIKKFLDHCFARLTAGRSKIVFFLLPGTLSWLRPSPVIHAWFYEIKKFLDHCF
ncbi:hypothetical protein QTL91_24550, partial [Salmonella enterica subsp. enterica serovar Typhimurium]|uniref:hypothetical protein n=1 Tax=Salmonella enterica TaxID=28901 RepID=UPI00263882E7